MNVKLIAFVSIVVLAVAIFFVLPLIPKGSFFPFYEALVTEQAYLVLNKSRVLQGEPISVAVGVFGTGVPFTTGLSPSYYYVGYFLDGQFIGFEQAGAREFAWSGNWCRGWAGDWGSECVNRVEYSLSTFPAFFRLIRGVYSYQINTAVLPVGNHTLSVAYAPVHLGSDYRNEFDLFQLGASCDASLVSHGSYGVDTCNVFGLSKSFDKPNFPRCGNEPFLIPESEWRSPAIYCNSCCAGSCSGCSGVCKSTYWNRIGVEMVGTCMYGAAYVWGDWQETVLFNKTREQAQSEIGWDVMASADFEVVQEISCGAGFEHPVGDVSQCVAIAGYCSVDADCAGNIISNGRVLGHCIGNKCISETVCDSGFDLTNGACVGQSVIPPVIPPIVPPIPPVIPPIVPPIIQQPPSNILIWLIVFGVIGFLIFIAWWSRD